jgi:hypothetical protein
VTPRILLSTPTNGMVFDASARSAERSSVRYKATCFRTRPESSVLTEAHNTGWCQGLNMDPRPDYYAQQHSDIVAQDGWIDTMVDELEACGAGLLAAVVAIKDDRGATSTTVVDPKTGMQRRLTMRDVYTLPETFGVEDIPWAPPGAILCANTGLWVCKFSGDWVEKIRFTIRDWIFKGDDGIWQAAFWPEDWAFSEDASKLGVTVKVTRKVKVAHLGVIPFRNDKPWGKERFGLWQAKEPPFTSSRPLPEGAHLGGFSVGGEPNTWAPSTWEKLLEIYSPTTVVDLGSGEGHNAEWFASKGCDVLAVDGAPEAVAACEARGLRSMCVDLTKSTPALDPVDMIWCSEVVEHIDALHIENTLAAFDKARVVALTHALPGDYGHHHVNCQLPDYWIEKLEARGFKYQSELSDRLRSTASEDAVCVRRSLLIFERAA